LRAGNSWPIQLAVHHPRDWDKNPDEQRTTDRRTDKGEWENQKLNAHAGGFNANTADFTEFIFRE
jgi:hypothetical protein